MNDGAYRDFSARVFDQAAGLVKAQFELTYRCNIRCVHCYTDPYNTPADIRRELSYEEILRILDELKAAGVLWLTLTGGEAVTHPRFEEIYRAARARGFVLTLLTNATLVSDHLLEFLTAEPPFQLEVSIHGASAGVFDRVTQIPGSFERFRAGLRRLVDRGLPVRLKTNALTANRGHLDEIQKFVEALGLEFHLYSTIYPRLNGDLSSTDFRLTPAEIVDLETGDEACGAFPGNSFQSPSDDRLFRCGCGTNTVIINPYGMIRPCTFTVWPTYDLRAMPLAEAFQKLAADIAGARYAGDSPCRSCTAHTICLKNPAMAQAEAGSMEAPVPHFCEVAFATQDRMKAVAP